MKTTVLRILLVTLASCSAASKGPTAMTTQQTSIETFRPTRGVAATNRNDLRRFVYDWFTHFEHATPVAFFLEHLDDKAMHLAFPGMAPLENHAAFTAWYQNLIAQTRWNFHDLSSLTVEETAPDEWRVQFIVDWYGEVRADSPQRANWQTTPGSDLYHHHLQQTWTVRSTSTTLTVATLVTTRP